MTSFKYFLLPMSWIACITVCNSTSNGYHLEVGIPLANSVHSSELLKIVGGSQSKTNIPYQAGIIIALTSGATSISGGSLVSRTLILTAAHCWFDGVSQAKQFTIVLGSLKIFSGGTRVVTKDVTVHASWNVEDITNDIALAKFPAVTLSNTIKTISLPASSQVSQDFTGNTALASGFGKMTDAQTSYPPSTTLHQASLKIISNTECQKSFADVKLQSSHLCTSGVGRVGTCDGDSGGPLVVKTNGKDILVGIVSFGLADQCQSGHPSVYTRVTSFLTWISSRM